jgi:hypothetical protein
MKYIYCSSRYQSVNGILQKKEVDRDDRNEKAGH